jgi:hypothetical protein
MSETSVALQLRIVYSPEYPQFIGREHIHQVYHCTPLLSPLEPPGTVRGSCLDDKDFLLGCSQESATWPPYHFVGVCECPCATREFRGISSLDTMLRCATVSKEEEPVVEHLKCSGQACAQAAEQNIEEEDSFALG